MGADKGVTCPGQPGQPGRPLGTGASPHSHTLSHHSQASTVKLGKLWRASEKWLAPQDGLLTVTLASVGLGPSGPPQRRQSSKCSPDTSEGHGLRSKHRHHGTPTPLQPRAPRLCPTSPWTPRVHLLPHTAALSCHGAEGPAQTPWES